MQLAATPCTNPVSLTQDKGKRSTACGMPEPIQSSQLSCWLIQMRLVRPQAPYIKEASLLVAADCTAFAYPAIQQDFLKGRVALVGCPKLEKLVAEAVKRSGSDVPCRSFVVGIEGTLTSD